MVNEFSLIETYFKSISPIRTDVIEGIGDDAACLRVPADKDLVVSTDTLVEAVHFFKDADPYHLGIQVVGVNVSDIVAVGAMPAWATLALTIPSVDESWLSRFSEGLKTALTSYGVALVGGDTTKGPLTITLTIHGLVSRGQMICRKGALVGDKIYVTTELGLPALALERQAMTLPSIDLNWVPILSQYATSAIDISDGLSQDLAHICEASGVGACLVQEAIPIHPLVIEQRPEKALDFALSGGDEYQLCLTVSPQNESAFLKAVNQFNLSCFAVGVIESKNGLRLMNARGEVKSLTPKGYQHFRCTEKD